MDGGNGPVTRVFLADGRELLRLGIVSLLAVQADFEVVGEAARAADVLARVRATRPDVVVVGELETERAVAELCRELRSEPEPPTCLLLTGVHDARPDGGCIPEDVHGGELVAMLRRLAAGAPLRDGRTRPSPPSSAPAEPPDPLDGLSRTDREIVALIGEGMTNRQIGTRLGLSERTIKNHVSGVLAFLGMERRTQIAALASTLRQPAAS